MAPASVVHAGMARPSERVSGRLPKQNAFEPTDLNTKASHGQDASGWPAVFSSVGFVTSSAGRRVADGGLRWRGWSAERRPANARAKVREGSYHLMQVRREGKLCRKIAATVCRGVALG